MKHEESNMQRACVRWFDAHYGHLYNRTVTKDHIAQIAKIRTKTLPTHRDIAKAVKALPYRFLMKTPAGYCFPANGREWKAYVERREKQARGLLHEAIDQSGFNYNDFKNSLA